MGNERISIFMQCTHKHTNTHTHSNYKTQKATNQNCCCWKFQSSTQSWAPANTNLNIIWNLLIIEHIEKLLTRKLPSFMFGEWVGFHHKNNTESFLLHFRYWFMIKTTRVVTSWGDKQLLCSITIKHTAYTKYSFFIVVLRFYIQTPS